MTDKKRFLIYLLVAFGGGWLCMGLGMLLGGTLYQVLTAAAMLMPMLGVLVSHGGLKYVRTGIRWAPVIAGHGRAYLLAWLAPGVMSLLCAALYFALFPARFDPGLGYLTASLPAGTELPFPPAVLAAIQLVEAMTYAPFLNMLLAVGEEAGWRGYMTPYLTARFGRVKGLALSGCIWALWHGPLILLAGYEYGTGYFGTPLTGLLLMCIACTALGVLLSFLYEQAGSVWAPALAHGGLNAAAGIGILFLRAGETSYLLGPTPMGLVSGIPVFALAAFILLRGPKETA